MLHTTNELVTESMPWQQGGTYLQNYSINSQNGQVEQTALKHKRLVYDVSDQPGAVCVHRIIEFLLHLRHRPFEDAATKQSRYFCCQCTQVSPVTQVQTNQNVDLPYYVLIFFSLLTLLFWLLVSLDFKQCWLFTPCHLPLLPRIVWHTRIHSS